MPTAKAVTAPKRTSTGAPAAGTSSFSAGTSSSNRHFSKQVAVAPTKEVLQMQLREFDFRAHTWQGVEAKFRELHGLLSAPTSGLNAAQERIQQKEAVSSALVTFLDMCQAECRRLLAEGKEKPAVEGGLATLNLKREYYGNNSLQLVSAFFHLARTNQCLGHIRRAEEFLSLAQLQIMRHPGADNSLKAELHQIYGLLFASDGRQDQALKHLTCAAYYLSTLNGPEHILTAFCYFDLGNVFAALNHMENTMAFYEKVKDIWYVFLGSALQRMLDVDRQVRAAEDDEIAAAIAANAEKMMGEFATSYVGAENVQDAARMLQAVVGLQRDRFGVVHPATARAELIHGFLLLWTGERTPAYETLVRAHEIARRCSGERHEVAVEAADMLQSFGMSVPEDAAQMVDELVKDLAMQKAAMMSSHNQQQQQLQEQQQQQQNQHRGSEGSFSAPSASAPSASSGFRVGGAAAAASAEDPELPSGASASTAAAAAAGYEQQQQQHPSHGHRNDDDDDQNQRDHAESSSYAEHQMQQQEREEEQEREQEITHAEAAEIPGADGTNGDEVEVIEHQEEHQVGETEEGEVIMGRDRGAAEIDFAAAAGIGEEASGEDKQ